MIAICDTSEQQHSNVFEMESKFICENLARLRELALSSGFEEIGVSTEIDSYYSNQTGEFISNRTCLRIREKDGLCELTFKGPSADHSSFFTKKEINVKIAGTNTAAHNLLLALGYQLYVTLSKRRQSFRKMRDGIISNVVIDNLDVIDTTFVECEVITSSSDQRHAAQKTFEDLKIMFEPVMFKEVNAPYRDIVADNIRQRLLNCHKLKALLVDFDGTLVDSEHVYFQSWQKVMRQCFGAEFSSDDYLMYELNQSSGLLEALRSNGRLCSPLSDSSIMNMVFSEYESAFDEIYASPFTRSNLQFFERLRAKFEIIIVTSSKRAFVEKAFAAFGFECPRIISAESVNTAKPDPAGYVRAMEMVNVGVDEILAIEDSLRGIEAARRAGLHVVAVTGDPELGCRQLEDMQVPIFQNFGQIALLLING